MDKDAFAAWVPPALWLWSVLDSAVNLRRHQLGRVVAGGRRVVTRVASGRFGRRSIAAALAGLIAVSASSACFADEIRVWLMPNEPAADEDTTSPFESQLADFNARFGEGRPVTVANTTEPSLVDGLRALDPGLVATRWSVVRGQTGTLDALERFAKQRDVHVLVKFVSWDGAFADIRSAVSPQATTARPDVVQIGTTWRAALAQSAGAVQPVPYLTDVRLLYYWRWRAGEGRVPHDLDTSQGWAPLLQSLAAVAGKGRPDHAVRPMVIPIRMDANLLHNFAPLVWTRGAPFVIDGTARIDLASDAAVAAPLALAREAAGPDSVVAIPEMSAVEARRRFLAGSYSAIPDIVGFLPDAVRASRDDVERLGVVAMLPGFRGGSELLVSAPGQRAEKAAELARFLTSDPEHARALASHGLLLTQGRDQGADDVVAALGLPPERASSARAALKKALDPAVAYLDLPEWPRVIESPDSLEAFQHLWRRIGAGGPEAAVRDAAEYAERTVNERLSPPDAALLFIRSYWPHVLAVGALALLALLYSRHRHVQALRRRDEAMLQELRRRDEAIRELGAMSSNALQAALAAHHVFTHGPSFRPLLAKYGYRKDLSKLAVCREGLAGWERGNVAANWAPCGLDKVVWRAVLQALRIHGRPDLRCDDSQDASVVRRHLIKERALADASGAARTSVPVVRVRDAEHCIVELPLVLEQALVNLVHNALRASYSGTDPEGFEAIDIVWDGESHALRIVNRATGHEQNAPPVIAAINGAKSVTDLREAFDRLTGPESNPDQWPGVGLVDAYCVIHAVYGRLRIDIADGEARATITFDRHWRRAWR